MNSFHQPSWVSLLQKNINGEELGDNWMWGSRRKEEQIFMVQCPFTDSLCTSLC